MISACEDLEWTRETGQQSLFLNIDFDKAYDQVDWSFVFEKLTCLSFGPSCVAMVNTFLINVLAFDSTNNFVSLLILLH